MKFNKSILIVCLLFFSLESNLLFPVSVFAQTPATTSSTTQNNILPINPSPQVAPIPTDSLIPQLSLTGPTTQQNTLRTSPVVQKLAKRFYRSDENVHVAIDNTQSDSFHVSIIDPKGQQADVAVQTVTDTADQVAFDIAPRSEFHPGKYKLILTDALGKSSEQDFTWGVLAINMDKSIYLPGQTADLSMAVLNDMGNMVCDAKVSLQITNSQLGISDTVSTDNGKIIVNKQCESHNFSLKPDYEANYTVGQAGNYTLTLTATTPNGTYTITDKIIVQDTVSFDVQRISATRIYPPNNYPVQLNITANQDFTGMVTETVPQDFTITSSDTTNSYDNLQTVYINPQKDPANQLAKQFGTTNPDSTQVLGASTSASQHAMSPEESTLVLPFIGSFPITEGFGAEQTDPSLQAFYQKYGLAGHDGIDFGLPVGTPIRAVDDGNILLAGPGDYGITIIMQHSWGKSYYGHLSKVLIGADQHVTKGQAIAISGDTGEATGPHLHFGMKPNIPDMLNGYFGKIDPLPYFHLPPNANIALGTSTQIASASTTDKVLGASTSAAITTPQSITDTPISPVSNTLVNQVRAQVLDMPATPVNNRVKVLSWHVSLKKGDKISLGYTFKSPLVSPQFYLLGPLTFYADGSNKQPVFEEQRQWQIAADAVGAAWYNYNWQYRKQITVDHTKVGSATVDATSSTVITTTTNSFNWNHTVTSTHGSNLLLMVQIVTSNTTNTVQTVTYNGVSLTKLPSGQVNCNTNCRDEVWYMTNPATGTNAIAVTTLNTAAVTATAISFYDVNQTTPFNTTASTASVTGTETSSSFSVPSATQEVVVDFYGNQASGTFTPTAGANQTQQVNVGNSIAQEAAISTKNGASPNTTMAWTWTSGNNYADVGVGINAVDLASFPVLVNLPSDNDLKANAQSTGNDILFTDNTGQTKLNHEIENYTSGTGELEAWIKVPTLSSTTDTVLYIYYGNPAATNQQNATAVWDSNYLAVYHLGQVPTASILDSTTLANNGTTHNLVSGDSIAGQIDGALNFNTNKYIDVGTGGTVKGSTQYTVSAWFNVTAFTAANKMQIYSECTNVSGTTRVNFGLTATNPGQITLNGRDLDANGLTTFITNSTTLSTATWYYASAVYDSTSTTNNMHLMLNGTDQTASLSKNTISNTTPGGATEIGGHCAEGGSPTENWNGKIDELRVSNTARSGGWNQTEYNNMNSPSTFYTLGSVETAAIVPTLDQLMRHGQWFCPTSECATNPGKQPYTF